MYEIRVTIRPLQDFETEAQAEEYLSRLTAQLDSLNGDWDYEEGIFEIFESEE